MPIIKDEIMSDLEQLILQETNSKAKIRKDIVTAISSSKFWSYYDFKMGTFTSSKLIWEFLEFRENQKFSNYGGIDKTGNFIQEGAANITYGYLSKSGYIDYFREGEWTIYEMNNIFLWAFQIDGVSQEIKIDIIANNANQVVNFIVNGRAFSPGKG
jgi:hypothetical protein